MNYNNFNHLAELDRADAASKKGVLLCERKEAFHHMKLYQLDDFYVEMVYHTHFNVLLRMRSFKDPRHLEPYLSTIDIQGLFA